MIIVILIDLIYFNKKKEYIYYYFSIVLSKLFFMHATIVLFLFLYIIINGNLLYHFLLCYSGLAYLRSNAVSWFLSEIKLVNRDDTFAESRLIRPRVISVIHIDLASMRSASYRGQR